MTPSARRWGRLQSRRGIPVGGRGERARLAVALPLVRVRPRVVGGVLLVEAVCAHSILVSAASCAHPGGDRRNGDRSLRDGVVTQSDFSVSDSDSGRGVPQTELASLSSAR